METSRQELVIVLTLLLPRVWATAGTGTLVYPRLLESRADDGDFLLHVHEALTLNLRKSSVLAKDFVITSTTSIGSDKVVLNGTELERDLYHDTEHQSSLLVTRRGSDVEVRGILNNKLRIAPAALAERPDEDLIPHEIFTVEQRSSVDGTTTDEPENVIPKDNASFGGINNTNFPDQFVVELCVVVGPRYQRAFNGTKDLITYIATMINAVALFFTEVTEPAIRFQLNGILTPQNEEIGGRNICGPTIDQLSTHNTCAADIISALNATVNMTNLCEFTHCDLPLQLISGNVAMEVNETFINGLVNGAASFAGVCTNDSAVVAVDEPLTFSGVSTMAHEIAHALGATHDGENQAVPINGYPNDLNCSWQDGYLMSPVSGGQNRGRLSNCTKAQMKFLISTLSESCILVNTKANYPNYFYPGNNITLETFCRIMHPLHEDAEASILQSASGYPQCKIKCCWKLELGAVQEREEDNLDNLWSSENYEYENPIECEEHRMLDAMSCGENKTCRQGVCGEHNWTEIYNTYRTYRTFETL